MNRDYLLSWGVQSKAILAKVGAHSKQEFIAATLGGPDCDRDP